MLDHQRTTLWNENENLRKLDASTCCVDVLELDAPSTHLVGVVRRSLQQRWRKLPALVLHIPELRTYRATDERMPMPTDGKKKDNRCDMA